MFDRILEGRWWDKAWSLVSSCTPCSPGCDHCWLRAMDRRFRKPTGSIHFRSDRLDLPQRRKKPTAWAIWSDLFHPAITDKEIRAAVNVMRVCPQHVFLVLTKRAERMAKWTDWPLNVWAGVTVCNQEEADEKVPLLLRVPARVRFLSVEPMLDAVDIYEMLRPPCPACNHEGTIITAMNENGRCSTCDGARFVRGVDCVICGGESGPGARPMHSDWARSLRDQCQEAGIPFFFKQWGAWSVGPGRPSQLMARVGKKRAGRILDGREWNELPEASK